jgi:hypothetical protein
VKAITDRDALFFKKNMGLYLYYRSKVPLDAHSYLPNMVNEMVHYLAKEMDQNIFAIPYIGPTPFAALCWL